MADVSFTNFQEYGLDEDVFSGVANKVLDRFEAGRGMQLSVVLVDAVEMKRLNKVYRGKDSVTDVLSFNLGGVSDPGPKSNEIVLCWEEINRQAQNNKKSFNYHLIYLLIHGILHLLGYEHEGVREEDSERMFALQASLVGEFDV